MRLEARVGERPAGAVRGDGVGAGAFALRRAAGDLGWRMFRAAGAAVSLLDGLKKSFAAGETGAALVREKVEGLVKLLARSVQRSVPLDRFEKSMGAMFSELSTSSTSEAFRFMGEEAMAWEC